MGHLYGWTEVRPSPRSAGLRSSPRSTPSRLTESVCTSSIRPVTSSTRSRLAAAWLTSPNTRAEPGIGRRGKQTRPHPSGMGPDRRRARSALVLLGGLGVLDRDPPPVPGAPAALALRDLLDLDEGAVAVLAGLLPAQPLELIPLAHAGAGAVAALVAESDGNGGGGDDPGVPVLELV